MTPPRTPPSSKPLVPACAYIRVSKEKKDDAKGFSPEQQLHEIQQYAERHGYRIVKKVQDIDLTGRTFTDRRVGEVIEDIEAGAYKVVILWKWSRWGRNVRESLIHIAKVERAGGTVAAATEHFDATTSIGGFSRDLMLGIAELQSNQIGEGWKETQARRRRGGLTHSGGPRFGYTYIISETKGVPSRYDVDPVRAAMLVDAYRRYVEGSASMRAIAAGWNAAGILTTTGKRWGGATVRTTMDTGFAAGLIRERSQKPGNGVPNSRTLDAFDVWHKGAHEPIIDTATWEAYVARRKRQSRTLPRLRVPNHAVSGLLFCELCGARLVAQYSGKGRWRQWRCARDSFRHDPVGVSHIRIMAAVDDWLAEQAQGDGEGVAREAAKHIKGTPPEDPDRPVKELAALKAKRQKLVDGWMTGRVDDESYDTQRLILADQIEAADIRVTESDDRRNRGVKLPTAAEFRGLRVEFPRWSPQAQNAFLALALDGVVVSPGRGGNLRFVPANGGAA